MVCLKKHDIFKKKLMMICFSGLKSLGLENAYIDIIFCLCLFMNNGENGKNDGSIAGKIV